VIEKAATRISHKENVILSKKGKKRCSHCYKIKDLSAFGNKKSSWDGLMLECRSCRSKMHKEFYNNPKNHEKHKEYIRNYFRDYTKRIPFITKNLKILFETDSRAIDEFIKTDLFQDILRKRLQSIFQKSPRKRKGKTNKQIIMDNIFTGIDNLLIDGGLSDEEDEILKKAYDLLLGVKSE
jgi:hypothetical protein